MYIVYFGGRGTFAPLAPPGKGQGGQLPPLPPCSGVPDNTSQEKCGNLSEALNLCLNILSGFV